MKAMVCTAYGSADVLQLQEVEKPTPENDQVLIKVFASTVNIGDCRVRSFDVPLPFWLPYRMQLGLTRLKQPILGAVVAGEIEAVGRDVKRFREGDQVYGMDIDGRGAHAQYMCRSEEGALAKKPANMTYEEAAAVPHGTLTALTFLREKGKVQSGQRVLINGASGAVGTAAVQLAKCSGAEVTGVCGTTNVELVKSLGADEVIDYHTEDLTRSGQTYDIIFDAVGKSSFSRCRDSLAPGGIYLATDPRLTVLLSMLWTSLVGSKKAIWALGPERAQDLGYLTELIEAGEIKAVIDRSYPLEQIAEAHSYVEKGHTRGNVVITVAG
ncbi:MAG: NAD(P)-dependent alcohol dehydrogenase [Anaerolineae bacterium]|jgi:NADPH:quinone reductase-like Zn-dependent oxidoreductase